MNHTKQPQQPDAALFDKDFPCPTFCQTAQWNAFIKITKTSVGANGSVIWKDVWSKVTVTSAKLRTSFQNAYNSRLRLSKKTKSNRNNKISNSKLNYWLSKSNSKSIE